MAWEAYETKLQQGGVPNAAIPPHRHAGHRDPTLTTLLGATNDCTKHANQWPTASSSPGSTAGWEALDALTGEPTATDLLAAMSDADPDAQQPPYEHSAQLHTPGVLSDVEDVAKGREASAGHAESSAVERRLHDAPVGMWTGLLLTALIVTVACSVRASSRSRPTKQTA